MVRVVCHQCAKPFDKAAGAFNRSKRIGASHYCTRACAGLAKRLANPPTPEQRKAAKAAYDLEYRARNAEALRTRRHEYFRRTYDPAEAKQYRAARMHLHIEYCRRPEYKAWKAQYDRNHRAKEYGPFSDAFLLLQDVENEIASQATKYEIALTNGTINKAQSRRRAMQ